MRPDPAAVTLNNGRKKALYQLSIAAIFVHIAISIGCYVVVAAVWRFRRKNWNGRLKNNIGKNGKTDPLKTEEDAPLKFKRKKSKKSKKLLSGLGSERM